jgi:hypothetical protein
MGLKRKEFSWALKLFMISIGLTFVLWLGLFVLSTLVFHSPEPVASTTVGVISLVMERVVMLEGRMGLWMAIFVLNTFATVVASMSSALLLLILPLQVNDIKSRMTHQRYEKIAKIIDKLIYALWKPFLLIFKRLDRGFAKSYKEDPPSSQFHGFWRYCGYSGIGFRNIFYVFPFVIPALTAIINGIIIGMVLAVNIFMGAYDGFLAAGLHGFTVGALLNFLYFLSVIMPHGIIELLAVLMAIALGQSFASMYSQEISEHGLLLAHRLEEFENELTYLVTLTKQFLKSRRILKALTVIICLLFLSAYIEVHITPNIAERVLTILREIWVNSFG